MKITGRRSLVPIELFVEQSFVEVLLRRFIDVVA